MVQCNSSKKLSGLRCLLLRGGWATYLKGFCPKPIKRFVRRWFPCTYEAYNRRKWRAEDPYADAEEILIYQAKVDVRLGIIKEFAHNHKGYVGACREMGVPYKILDISGPDWIEIVQECSCNAFLVHPSCELSVWKQMYDERLRVMVEDMGKIIYPTYDELWFYESKRRMCYWLQAHGIPHPQTWIFYNYDDAMEFARNTDLPIVFKSDFGSAAAGVKVFRSRSRLTRWVKHCFGKGIIRKDEDPRDRQWDSVLFQEYLPDVAEWRIIRIGESYFGYEKLKRGDFHSGSHLQRYARPSSELLSFVKDVTDKGQFTSMDVDVFVTLNGRYLVNELQTIYGHFGSSEPQCMIDGKEGRMIWDTGSESWQFEEGSFTQNYSCNLRVNTLLRLLQKQGLLTTPPKSSQLVSRPPRGD